MLTIFHSVFCADVLADSRTGQVSYFKIIDSLTAPSLPLNIKGPYVGALCQAPSDGNTSVRLDLMAPDNTAINLKSFEASFTGGPQKILIQLENVLFAQEGMHQILISSPNGTQWQALATMPVHVQLAKK